MSDIPAPLRKCYGLRPGAPCPAYDDGSWPDGCNCMQLRNSFTGTLTRAGVIVGLVVFALLFLALWAIVDVAFGADVGYNPHCLTKEQARAKFPNGVIYWHTANRCWNDVAPGRAVNRIAKGPRQDTQLDASGNATSRRVSPTITQERPSIYYPELMGGGGTSSDMLHPYAATRWQSITDFDNEPVPFIPWIRTTPLVKQ
jgi:hypothetical protein